MKKLQKKCQFLIFVKLSLKMKFEELENQENIAVKKNKINVDNSGYL